MKFHPLAELFPLMQGREFDEFVADVRANGLREPIVTYEGQILDGRNRWRACEAAQMVLRPMREYTGDDAVGFVVSLNLHRRHLDESQRAMARARLREIVSHGGDRRSGSFKASNEALKTIEDQFNASDASTDRARRVLREGAPEIVRAVDDGHLSVSLAAQVSDLPEDEQELIVALNEEPERMREVAREVVHNHRAQGTGENEWYTPVEHIHAVRELFGEIDLDPASSEHAQKTVLAKRYFTKDDDGLKQAWSGKIWLNPPYAQPAIAHFVDKLVSELPNISEAIMLTHNYTDTAWFHQAANACTAMCFTRGRIGFLSPEGKKAAPTQGQTFFYFGDSPQQFLESFKRFGFVVIKP